MEKLNIRSEKRIAFHRNQIAERKLLLTTLAVGSKGYERTLAAIAKDEATIREVELKMAARIEKASQKAAAPAREKSPRGRKKGVPLKGTFFNVELGLDLVGYNDNSSGALPVAV